MWVGIVRIRGGFETRPSYVWTLHSGSRLANEALPFRVSATAPGGERNDVVGVKAKEGDEKEAGKEEMGKLSLRFS